MTRATRTALIVAILAWAAFVVALLGTACAHRPATLGPAGVVAWNQHEVQKDLDLIRDVAQDAAAQTPPLISIATARQVTQWHTAAIQIVHTASYGWSAAVLAGLQTLKMQLPAADQARLGRYIDLAIAVVQGIK